MSSEAPRKPWKASVSAAHKALLSWEEGVDACQGEEWSFLSSKPVSGRQTLPPMLWRLFIPLQRRRGVVVVPVGQADSAGGAGV